MLSSMRSHVDHSQVAKAANELQEHHRVAFEERGGRLSVTAGNATNIRTRTKSLELHAGIERILPRIYDHIHVEVSAQQRHWPWEPEPGEGFENISLIHERRVR